MLLLLACSDYEVTAKDDHTAPEEDAGAPTIAVDPTAIAFGSLAVGASSDPHLVTVTNVGDAPLALGGVSVDEAAFGVTNPGSSLLGPGDSTTFTVTFTAAASTEVTGEALVTSDDPDEPEVPVALSGGGISGDIAIDPVLHDFGTLDVDATDAIAVTVSNEGTAPITITEVRYAASSSELGLDTNEAVNGALPWTLAAGDSMRLAVSYAPTDDTADEGTVTVVSDDADEPEIAATQVGNGRSFEGFSTGWYIVDDATVYETTSNPAHTVEYHGDLDGYWYEPSGAHGLIDSADPVADFATLHDYVVARAGAPTPVTGPLTFVSTSSVPSLTYASFSYILCDFWLDASDDPGLYEISSGVVDDGILVLVNGEILGNLLLGASGSWPLDNAVAGDVNSLVVILMDNAEVDKYLYDLAFYRDGVMVAGP